MRASRAAPSRGLRMVCLASGGKARSGPVVVVDNYDSFTYNLCQYLGDLGCDYVVFTNDEKTVDEILKMDPKARAPCRPRQPKRMAWRGIVVVRTPFLIGAPASLPLFRGSWSAQARGSPRTRASRWRSSRRVSRRAGHAPRLPMCRLAVSALPAAVGPPWHPGVRRVHGASVYWPGVWGQGGPSANRGDARQDLPRLPHRRRPAQG